MIVILFSNLLLAMCIYWLLIIFVFSFLLFQMRFVIVALINEHDNEDHNLFQKRCEHVEQFRDFDIGQQTYRDWLIDSTWYEFEQSRTRIVIH